MNFDDSRFSEFDPRPDDGREREFNLDEILYSPAPEGLDLGNLVDEAQEWLISNTPSFQRLQAQIKRGDMPPQFQIDYALKSLERTFQELSCADDTTHEDILGLNFALAIQLCNYERTEEGEKHLYNLLAGLREEIGGLRGLKAFVFTTFGQNRLKEGDLYHAAESFDDAIESIETHKIQHKETLLSAYATRAELYLHLTSKEDGSLTSGLSEAGGAEFIRCSMRALEALGDNFSLDSEQQRDLRIRLLVHLGIMYAERRSMEESEHYFSTAISALETESTDPIATSIGLRSQIANVFCHLGELDIMEKYLAPVLRWPMAQSQGIQIIYIGGGAVAVRNDVEILPAPAIFPASFEAARRNDRDSMIKRIRQFNALPGRSMQDVLRSYLHHFEYLGKTEALELTQRLLEFC